VNVIVRSISCANTSVGFDAELLDQRSAGIAGRFRVGRTQSHHILKKYGRDISTTPRVTSRKVLETKYGKIINTRPQISGTTIFCFLP
jgi:hypothetical protein